MAGICDGQLISPGPLHDFKDYYLTYVCPYTNFVVCVTGSLLNILNIAVFGRKNMASAMTTIFLHLAVVDLATLLIYIPTTWHICVQHKTSDQYVNTWEYFHLLSRCCLTVLYYISAWFTVMLAIWRYIAIAYPLKERDWCTVKRTQIMVALGYVIGFILNIPLFMVVRVEEHKTNSTIINATIEFDERSLLKTIHFVLYAIVLKLLPSIVLTVFSYKLIKALFVVKERRERMATNSLAHEEKVNEIKKQTYFTTKMLLGVLVLFLISEVPTGMLGLFSIIYGCKFRRHYFAPMVHVFYTIRLINISVTFFVYYKLSQQFRITFNTLFSDYLSPTSSNKVSQKSDTFQEC